MPKVKQQQPSISFPAIPRKIYDERTRYPRGHPAGISARRGGVNLLNMQQQQDNVLHNTELPRPLMPLDVERNAAVSEMRGNYEGIRWREA